MGDVRQRILLEPSADGADIRRAAHCVQSRTQRSRKNLSVVVQEQQVCSASFLPGLVHGQNEIAIFQRARKHAVWARGAVIFLVNTPRCRVKKLMSLTASGLPSPIAIGMELFPALAPKIFQLGSSACF